MKVSKEEWRKANQQFLSWRGRQMPSGQHPHFSDFVAFCNLNGRILDLGCGGGSFGTTFSYPPNYVGVDPTPVSSHPFRFVLGMAESLPFRSGSFDLVISKANLQHSMDVGGTLEESKRVLKRGGRFCAWTVVTRSGLHWKMQRALDIVRREGAGALLRRRRPSEKKDREETYGYAHHFRDEEILEEILTKFPKHRRILFDQDLFFEGTRD